MDLSYRCGAGRLGSWRSLFLGVIRPIWHLRRRFLLPACGGCGAGGGCRRRRDEPHGTGGRATRPGAHARSDRGDHHGGSRALSRGRVPAGRRGRDRGRPGNGGGRFRGASRPPRAGYGDVARPHRRSRMCGSIPSRTARSCRRVESALADVDPSGCLDVRDERRCLRGAAGVARSRLSLRPGVVRSHHHRHQPRGLRLPRPAIRIATGADRGAVAGSRARPPASRRPQDPRRTDGCDDRLHRRPRVTEGGRDAGIRDRDLHRRAQSVGKHHARTSSLRDRTTFRSWNRTSTR